MAGRARAGLERVGFFARGYDVKQVNDFVATARAAGEVRGRRPGGPLSAEDVRTRAFRMRRRGYDPVAVDRLMERLEDSLERSSSRADAGDLAATLAPRLDRPEGRRFARPAALRHGYLASDVDDLLARLAPGIAAPVADGPGDGSDPSEVRGAVFARARGARAYDVGVVDAYLDRVVAYLYARTTTKETR